MWLTTIKTQILTNTPSRVTELVMGMHWDPWKEQWRPKIWLHGQLINQNFLLKNRPNVQTMQAVLYFQMTLIKEDRAFRSINNKKYIFPSVKSAMLLCSIFWFIYIYQDSVLVFCNVGPCLQNWIYANSAFFQKVEETYARNDEYFAENYASTIYQSLPTGITSCWIKESRIVYWILLR